MIRHATPTFELPSAAIHDALPHLFARDFFVSHPSDAARMSDAAIARRLLRRTSPSLLARFDFFVPASIPSPRLSASTLLPAICLARVWASRPGGILAELPSLRAEVEGRTPSDAPTFTL